MTTATHRVTWDDDHPTFHCNGDLTSPCHNYPACECEAWTLDGSHPHPMEPHDECWMIPWLDAAPEDTWFDGGSTLEQMPKVEGEIDTEWEGECLLWCYVDSDVLAGA